MERWICRLLRRDSAGEKKSKGDAGDILPRLIFTASSVFKPFIRPIKQTQSNDGGGYTGFTQGSRHTLVWPQTGKSQATLQVCKAAANHRSGLPESLALMSQFPPLHTTCPWTHLQKGVHTRHSHRHPLCFPYQPFTLPIIILAICKQSCLLI